MINQLLNLFFEGLVTTIVIFTLTWLIQLKTKNAAIVDSVWAATFPLLTLLYFMTTDGCLPRKIMITVMVLAWGLRLATYLFIRTIGQPEDVRYTALRKEWGEKQNILMLRFYYFQALLALALTFPFALIMLNTNKSLSALEWTGCVLWIIALIGESIADAQMNSFRKSKANKGKVCNVGLWKFSRHPNYFFEWLIWVAFFIVALASPFGELSILCPMAILYFLLNLTGIPYTEAALLKSKGEAYEEYQRTTSAFIPLPSKIKLALSKNSPSQLK
jgi:steroid 5-alpha reductase family enzyme